MASNDLNLGTLRITIDHDAARANFDLPDGSSIVRDFPPNGDLEMNITMGMILGSGAVALPAPVNTVLPAITGTATAGETLTASTGTWTSSPTSYAYQWKADDAAISGATASTYELTDTQIGAVMTVTVTATNAAGSTAATSAGTDAVAAADEHFANVVLLVGFDGADGSTTFTDESSAARALTAVGNVQVDTAQSKFGGASGLFDGTGDAITAVDSADLHFDTGDFTVEAWVRLSSGFGDEAIVGHWGSLGGSWYFWRLSGNLELIINSGGASVSASWTPVADTWYHVAVDKDSSDKIRLYVDGAMIGSATIATSISDVAGASLGIGTVPGFVSSAPLNGWLDELRVTKGVARYASDGGFTVPAAAYPRS